MARLTRRESEQRHQAILEFFVANPTATGDEAQRALTSGRLTGSKGPPMGIGALFKLKRQAEQLLRSGRAHAPPPAAAASPAQLNELRDLTARLQTLLLSLPDVAEVRVTRAEARVVRNVTREEKL